MRLSAQMARRLQVTSEVGNGVPRRDGPHCTTLLNLAKQPDAMTHPDGMQIKITRQKSVRLSAVLVKPWDAF